MTRVPLSRPPVDDEIKQAVLAAIESRQYVLGPQCRQLETEQAAATAVKHAVLTS
jgi:dTDP-4-amino-4,6-dideoxygalactose transaminase